MTAEAIASLLHERMAVEIDQVLAGKLARYLQLLLQWNARTNLSAIREPETIVLRHFGESLQCAAALPLASGTLLDYGSGAGFPGAACALTNSKLHVTLAESQNKKAAFLLELCRHVPLSAEVYAGRVESLPPSRLFDVVTLRSVDQMEAACTTARKRVALNGWLLLMTTVESLGRLSEAVEPVLWQPFIPLRGMSQGIIAIAQVLAV